MAFREASGPAWKDTVVVVASEFGRTVRSNGTGGTDHGTGGLAMLFGGSVAGGKVHGDWPGLGPKALYQGRDLMRTTDIRAVFKGILQQHLRIDGRELARSVFPHSQDIHPLKGLIV
jgi:uncharacterized protein (DUF1501 family)